ncbi:MAG: YbbR-like domain-containing protein [Nitrospirae bacterium]|nr:YbbR-like domain-containing protein [Nitrospirota bacterium]
MKKFFTENTELKLITLVLSLILWFIVTLRGQTEVIMELPIEYKNIPKSVEITKTSAKFVSVSIKGQERIVKNLLPKDINVFVDLSKVKQGETMFYFTKENIKLPPSLTLAKFNPSNVIVQTEEVFTMSLPIKPVLKGTPKNGFIVDEVMVIPEEISATGSRQALNKLEYIETEPVNVKDADASFEKTVRLVLRDRSLIYQNDVVKVKITIAADKITGAKK